MTNETLETIKSRRSCRAYKPEQITDEELNAVLEAGTYAASAMGRQSAKIVVVQDAATRAQLTRMNAAVMGKDTDPMYGAPTILVVLADAGSKNAVQDGSLVMGNLMLAAASLGLGSCWVGGTFDRRSAVFEPSPEEEMVCVVPIGKVAQSSRKERMIRGVIHRKSKTIEEMVRADRPLTEEERQAMQLVQLAPTAKNTQKPVFIFAGDKIYAGVADDEPFDLVDLGICKLHFEIGMKQLFLQGHFEFGNGSIYKRS